MPRIFHAMRKRLIAEGRLSRYLPYALGEIALVVTGILVALAINTGNEARKARTFEVKMLHEVHNGLVRDTMLIHLLHERLYTVDTSTATLLRAYSGDTLDEAHLKACLNGMTTGIMMNAHRGPYEAILAVGLDRVSNDSVRTLLMDLYDYAIPRSMDLVHKEIDQFKPQREVLVHKLLVVELPPGVTQVSEPHWSPAVPDLQHHPELLTLVKYRRIEAINAGLRLTQLEQRIVALLGLLDRELGKAS